MKIETKTDIKLSLTAQEILDLEKLIQATKGQWMTLCRDFFDEDDERIYTLEKSINGIHTTLSAFVQSYSDILYDEIDL